MGRSFRGNARADRGVPIVSPPPGRGHTAGAAACTIGVRANRWSGVLSQPTAASPVLERNARAARRLDNGYGDCALMVRRRFHQKENFMVQNSTSLPTGAGATTSEPPIRSGQQPDPTSQGQSFSRRPSSASGDFESDFSGQELVVVEERSRPGTVAVVGAAIAGAVVGGAIPFMLSGRSSSAGSRSGKGSSETIVTESVIVNRPPRELYDFWRNFTNLPQFMDNIKSVERLDEKRSRWVIKAPAGTSVEFDSRVTEDLPGRAIAWQSEEGASVPNRGRVEFVETAAGGATNVRATISYDPPAGTAGRMIAKLFQREPSIQAKEDLARFKRLMESDSEG